MVQSAKEGRLAELPLLHRQPSRHRNLSQCHYQFCQTAEDYGRQAKHLFVTRREMEKTITFHTNSSANSFTGFNC